MSRTPQASNSFEEHVAVKEPDFNNSNCQNIFRGSVCTLAKSTGDVGSGEGKCECNGDPVKCALSENPAEDPYCCKVDTRDGNCCNPFRGDCDDCPYDKTRYLCDNKKCGLILDTNGDISPLPICPKDFTQMCIDNKGALSIPSDGVCDDDDGRDPVLFCQNNDSNYFVTRNLDGTFECNSKKPNDDCKFTQCTITSDFGMGTKLPTEKFMNISGIMNVKFMVLGAMLLFLLMFISSQ
jgi:hypothetical protein